MSGSAYLNTMLSCSLLEQISNHGIAKTATYLSQDSIANVIIKYAEQLILGIRGCVCGVSSSSLKMIPQVWVTGRDSEIEQGPEVAMV